MFHWCLLDKECREYTNTIHFDFVRWGGRYHYTVFLPYDPGITLFKTGSAWQRPGIKRSLIPSAVLKDRGKS